MHLVQKEKDASMKILIKKTIINLSFLCKCILFYSLLLNLVSCTSSTKSNQTKSIYNNKNKFSFSADKLSEIDDEKLKPFTISFFNEKVNLSHAVFGYINTDGKKPEFVVTNQIPYKPGVNYGWGVKLKSSSVIDLNKMQISFNEALILPSAPRIFRYDKSVTSLNAEGTKAMTKLKLAPFDGWVFNFWAITLEDPKGPHSIELFQGENFIQKFNFNIN